MNIDLLIHAGWVIPVEPENAVFENQSLAINKGRILGILPRREAESKYQPDTVQQLNRHALIPGFVNCHTHAAMSYLRGIADDLPLMQWLNDFIWPLEQKWVSEQFVADGTELAIAEMLRGGTTCFNDMYFFPEASAQQAIKAGIRANIGMILIDFPSAWADNADEYIAKGLAVHDEFRHQPLISTGFAPHAPYTVCDDSFRKIRTLADELEVPIHIHLHETQTEIKESIEQFGVRPLERMKSLDLLDRNLIAVHMTQMTDSDVDAFAESGGSIVHCPESNLKLASGFCPVARLLKAGINVALGTDSAASNNDLDMLGEAKTAALLAKGVDGSADAVPAHMALRMATIHGAMALGLEHEIGSLEVGKSADITAISMDTLETLPLFDPVSQLVYSANRNQVTDVWVAGKHVLKSRKLANLNMESIIEKTAYWRSRLMEN